ncbi:CapA family protein [Acetobacteraceae bacterium]|nr:CapA family protein [Candidatus Parcubacteria bacterium]
MTLKNFLFFFFLGEIILAGAFFAAYNSVSRFQFSASAHETYAVPIQVEKPVRVLFAGDIMLDRDIARNTARVGVESFVADVAPLFANNDINVANLEGTVTDFPSIAQIDNTVLRFTFTPALAESVLTSLKLDAVSLANNHALDFGAAGYSQTRDFLSERGILSFGSPSNSENLSAQKTVRGNNICFVGYEDFINADPTIITNEITSIRPFCYRVVVFTHWGVEYQIQPTEHQRMLAHAFIDSGADLVIGAHPHVVQPREIYNGKAIFYSLGNFIFDQYFSSQTKRGIAVAVEFYSFETRFTLTPVSIERDGITRIPGELESFSLPL